jgi:hypothetical protein
MSNDIHIVIPVSLTQSIILRRGHVKDEATALAPVRVLVIGEPARDTRTVPLATFTTRRFTAPQPPYAAVGKTSLPGSVTAGGL